MILLAAGLGLAALGLAARAAEAGTREAQWKQVEEAVKAGLPKTAIERLQPIIDAALADKAYGEAVKAIGRKIALEGTIQGNKPEEKITRLEAEINKAPKPMVPLLEAVLADWYWQYFSHNRWRFMQRTATAQSPGKDFTTWDLPRLFAEIDKHYARALADPAELKRTAIGQFDDLLEKGGQPDRYRPTLYDFLVHEALTFYSSGEQAAAKAEEAFELSADSPIFAPTADFLKWEPGAGTSPPLPPGEGRGEGKLQPSLESEKQDPHVFPLTLTLSRRERGPDVAADGAGPILKAIRLYQDLLRFHQADEEQSAFLDTDLLRLEFGHNKAFGEEKAARYKAALKRYVERNGDHEVSARARYDLAGMLQLENELPAAHELAEQGARVFPASAGGRLCYNLARQIEARSSSISIERVWNAPWPTIRVSYRNVKAVYFRAIREDWLERMKSGRPRPEWLDQPQRKALLARQPDLAWSAVLPDAGDFRERSEELAAPPQLKPGYYFLLASHDPTFTDHDNMVTAADFWVSTLALVMRSRPGAGSMEGFVLDAASGEPIAGAAVQDWGRDWNGGILTGGAGKTDSNGFFSVAGVIQRQNVIHAAFRDQQLATANDIFVYSQDIRPKPHEQTIFFTDRSLYRPGQTIQYKGIAINVDQEGDDYKALPGRTLTVVFQDVSGKQIERREQRTNDYGSFSGSFTAPRDRLMGQMVIRVEGQPAGAAVVRVEEYKRPKFQVTLEAPKAAPKLGAKVQLEGKALAYTGAAVGGAKVRYHVVRQVRYPDWWGWWHWWQPVQTVSKEIAHGTAATGPEGAFTVEFTAQPDLSVPEQDEPTFEFAVSADVTDTTGETRSAQRSVQAGYTALRATLAAGEWLTDEKPLEITVSTRTLDGEPQRAEGGLKIYRLKQPEKVERPSLFGPQPFHQVNPRPPVRRGKAAGKAVEQPPGPKADPSNPNSWELGAVVAEEGLTTDLAGTAHVSAKLAAGAYRAKFETQDRFGKKVVAWLPLEVLAPDAKRLPIMIPNLVAAPRWSLEPGQEFMALWGTGYQQGRAFIEIEHRGRIVKGFWTEPGATQQKVTQAVSESMRGGFSLHVTMVRENRAYLTARKIDVPWSNKELSVKWEHFVSKLEPGKRETWTAIITAPDAKKAVGTPAAQNDAVKGRHGDAVNPEVSASPRPRVPASSADVSATAVAEMVAALYDQSLDAYLPHAWPRGFGVFRQDWTARGSQFENMAKPLFQMLGAWPFDQKDAKLTYRSFPASITVDLWGYMYYGFEAGFGRGAGRRAALAAPMAAGRMERAMAGEQQQEANGKFNLLADDRAANGRQLREVEALKRDGAMMADKQLAGGLQQAGQAPGALRPDLGQVAARKNLNETAFFFPHLVAGSDGLVKIEFTMPEALTQWKFLGFAHDGQLRSGLLEDKAVTAKDIMVQPNPPRFLREGDVLEFTVKVSNQSATRQAGSVRLTLADARTAKPLDAALGNTDTDRGFDLPAKQSQSYAWRLAIPDGTGPLSYKAVGSTGRLSDGEEGLLPVLVRRTLVTESMPLPIRGPETKSFDFARLRQSGQSKTLRHESLTVEMVSQPAWYAVMALPYLMEFPYECTEQVFNRLYANALARHIAGSDPKIGRIFEQWKGTPALDSPLEKNQDLKSVLLEETPWVRQAASESQARRNVGILFDENRLNDETTRLLAKLAEMQMGDGAWPWFPGGPPNDYITLYITTGYGRLRHLGVKLDTAAAVKSLGRLDGWIDRMYRDILQAGHPDENHLSSTVALYLYGRSFFLEDRPVAPGPREAVDYFLGQARRYWLAVDCRQSQAHLAIALKRFGDRATPAAIMRSIKERSVSDDELGMFWRDTELSWWWYRAPIETQAMMIEAFDEVMSDAQTVEDCKVWLLKQKQTQDWKTTKATADAVYALLLRGTGLLKSDQLVEVTLGPTTIKPEKVEAGTGYFQQRFARGEIMPELGRITVRKLDAGVAWGSVHWQYLEDTSKITPYAGTPLRLTKSLWRRQYTAKGPVLEPVGDCPNFRPTKMGLSPSVGLSPSAPLQVGDELVVRITLHTDRDMEYVHLKDYRASGTEPEGVLSHYKYQDGLGYYESTRDTASHFFIDYLPKGTYVFEYAARVVHKGQYQTGMAQIQCMYAPEFNSHSESFVLDVP
jgi:hypothetical protein